MYPGLSKKAQAVAKLPLNSRAATNADVITTASVIERCGGSR
jgi:hypothetical protein